MKILLLFILGISFYDAKGVTWNVNVENFQFSPSSLNVSVGDVIHWIWVGGFHTTTSTASIPAGAASWDAPITSGSTTFDYTVTTSGTYNYQCDIHGSSMSGSFTASIVLPVILSSFTVTTKNDKPLLLWVTASEANADYFSIRKSINGTDFMEISKIPAAGNSSSQKKYFYSDEKISAANQFIYYSLATVDKNGEMQLSPIKIFRNKRARPKLILSLSPNPISDMGHLLISFNAGKNGTMVAKLTDAKGSVILITELSAVQGINKGHIHLGDVQKGVYILNFSLDGARESYRIVRD